MDYKGIKYYLEKYINKSISDNVIKMYDDIRDDFMFFPASVKYHHNYRGGLEKHTEEVIYCALSIFKKFEDIFRKKFVTESDVVLVAFIHDLEKIYKYIINKDYDSGIFKSNVYEFKIDYNRVDMNDTAQVVRICGKYGIYLSDKQMNALTLSHGGWSVDSKGSMTALASIIHAADLLSVYAFN